MLKSKKMWWIISLGGYEKNLAFYGNQSEAEQYRISKSEWEGLGGRKLKAKASNPKHVELVEQKRESVQRMIGKGIYKEPLPPLEDAKETAINKGIGSFIKYSDNVKYTVDASMIKIIPETGEFEIDIVEKGVVQERHVFKTFERASNYVTIMNLL